MSLAHELEHELRHAETKAWDSLARYKFQMFGYWAAIWVHLNRIGGFARPNPWTGLVAAARDHEAATPQLIALPMFPQPLETDQ